MKAIALLGLLAVALAFADGTDGRNPSAWRGPHGDLFIFDSEAYAPLPTAAPDSASLWFSQLIIYTADTNATGFTVTISYKIGRDTRTATARADMAPAYPYTAVVYFPEVRLAQIVSVSISKRYDGPAVVLQ